jgi:hypothetical protein
MYLPSNYYLGGGYLPYDPKNPDYETNILRLAEKNPRHPEVQKYRKLMAEETLETQPVQQEGLGQDDDAYVKEMVKLAEDDTESENDPVKSDDQLILDFCNGTGPFADKNF